MLENNNLDDVGKTTVTTVNDSPGKDNEYEIKPFPNPFKEFATSTYSASIYLQSPGQYNEMVENGRKDVRGLPLIIQSGGINNGDARANFGAKRSEFFENDFYLDNIQFKSLVSGTAVGAPHNSYEINFNVTEPMGLTFLDRLNREIQKFNGDDPNFNFINQQFIMVIRFYGYDENGKQISAENLTKASTPDVKSDPAAFAEKWIPFRIRNISFRLAAEQVVYSVEAIPAVTYNGNDQLHGVIPFNIGLQGQSLGTLLNGTATKVQADTNRSSSSTSKQGEKGMVLSGLGKILNDWQEKLVQQGKQEYADTYTFKIDDEKLANAELLKHGTELHDRTGMPNGQDNAAIIKNVTGESQVIKNVKTMSISAGLRIMTFLDLAIRTSSYISDQYEVITDRTSGDKFLQKKEADEPLKWFKIRPTVKIKEGKYDCIRNMYAVDITYVITPHTVNSLDNYSYTSTNCVVPHKEYEYWFTGKNTEVLNFAQNFNALYYTTFGASHLGKDARINDPSRQYNLRQMKGYKVNSTQDNQGDKEKLAGELAANAASTLYSPADQGTISLDIVGDPDWIVQSELFYSADANSTFSRTMPDRSVNPDAAEVFFALTFNTVVDYDTGTGVADVTQKNYITGPEASPSNVAQYSFFYRANTITTELTQGKFTQRLEGTLAWIPEECITGKKKPQEKIRDSKEQQDIENKNNTGTQKNTSTTSKSAGQKTKKERFARADIKKLCKGKPQDPSESGTDPDATPQ